MTHWSRCSKCGVHKTKCKCKELPASLVGQAVMRPLGFYEVKKREKWTRAEWTEHGWKVLWSNWYQTDNDLDGIRAEKVGFITNKLTGLAEGLWADLT